MTGKILKILLIAAVLTALIWAGKFYWENLRGAGVVIERPAAQDEAFITDINTTGLPLTLPAGFSISIYAEDLVNPRVLAYAPSGHILASIPSEGRVVALIDQDKDGVAELQKTVIDKLNRPHGMAFRCADISTPEVCKFYIAETDQVAEYDYDAENLKAVNKKKLFDLPGGGNHFTRTIIFTPLEAARAHSDPLPLTGFRPYPNDSKMLVSVGSSCNVCTESDSRRAKILEYDFETGQLADFAVGLRNSVFMAIHPVTGAIWATEMGRDLLGDDIPPDEINIISSPSMGSGQNSAQVPNFGWPICYGKNIHDDNFDPVKSLRDNGAGKNDACKSFEPSHIDIPAHSAPLGLAFFPEEGRPEEYWHNLLVAYHGSWNRTVPTGYKIVRYKLDAEGNYLGQEDFIVGWIDEKNKVYGRPVDILIQPGGTIFISDDKAGVVYKVVKKS
ncbi:hypothetical protein A3A09_03435 [Candidatus Nomurabacteria bacterium RIFCSPLOWO2_01_FULL_42_20]|uniref:Pyrroloquinoline quinone-dependent pyranose dehydrogenase beta-propeller domain-containing protein n=1 Tax=Candidatus Nomurabacteria bacterium RIFCSPHIGHO2_01_FULL_42_16 TaxID=1801743 RepID=A0A1F6VJN2_9BACT|nr:MAG: hypothetical protein A2824_01545 [Candidatus Nomurabacteria bacterium RIFCSPHIGHO2_01_FULL_42_16]OGI91438.1 MAG: hypothetical protein A3A09_03435 [Candidatus Nomurabacteria bacterium RIFCSPLOWO2_01_FULL_42_20]